MDNQRIAVFEDPKMQVAYNEAVDRKICEPAFAEKVYAMAQREVNDELIDSCRKTNGWLAGYITKTLDPLLEKARKGMVFSKINMDTEKTESALRKAAKVLAATLALVMASFVALSLLESPAMAKESADDIVSGQDVEDSNRASEPADGKKATVQSGAIEAVSGYATDRLALTRYLNERNPELVKCVGEIVNHERWVEAVAITRIETQFCRTGHGPSPKNNCGNISSSLPGRPNGRFKTYNSKCDSIEDIAILLETGRYKNVGIAEMNGTYCVNEVAGTGECNNWTEVTMEEVEALRGIISEEMAG